MMNKDLLSNGASIVVDENYSHLQATSSAYSRGCIGSASVRQSSSVALVAINQNCDSGA